MAARSKQALPTTGAIILTSPEKSHLSPMVLQFDVRRVNRITAYRREGRAQSTLCSCDGKC